MPRRPRLDGPGVLHHVIARGIERQPIFHDDGDRDDLLSRLASLVDDGSVSVFAWALMPNHFHLLVRTGTRPLERSMRSLLTGVATRFNRRHGRVGHLFQNRYKSIVCEAERYFLELVRYIHLNPLRARIVTDFDALDDYPYTGHATLLGMVPRPWQSTEPVLAAFGLRRGWARAAYRNFVSEGVSISHRPDLLGRGLARRPRGWIAVAELRRGRERFTLDERVLGSDEFVERVLREIPEDGERPRRGSVNLRELKEAVSMASGVAASSLSHAGRARTISRVRDGISYLWVEFLGESGRILALDFGTTPQAVYRGAKRGRVERDHWIRIFDDFAAGRRDSSRERLP
jgi:putative transposase